MPAALPTCRKRSSGIQGSMPMVDGAGDVDIGAKGAGNDDLVHLSGVRPLASRRTLMPVRMAPLASWSSRTSFWVKVMSGWPPSRSSSADQDEFADSAFTAHAGVVDHAAVGFDHASLVELGQGIQDARAAEADGRAPPMVWILEFIVRPAAGARWRRWRRACRV